MDRSSSYRSSVGRSVGTIPSYNGEWLLCAFLKCVGLWVSGTYLPIKGQLNTLFQFDEDMFLVCPHRPEILQEFLHHINSQRPAVRFTMEMETNNILPFLDDLVTKWGSTLRKLLSQN